MPTANEAAIKMSAYSEGTIYSRWLLGKNNTNKSGSDLGSDFIINKYNDGGTYLGQPVFIKRSTVYINLSGTSSTTPSSSVEIDGSLGTKVKSTLVSGTTNPDDTAIIWQYNSGTGTIVLPDANTCINRIYVIINQTGNSRNISSYKDLSFTSQTILANATGLWIVSNGTDWLQIK